MFQLLVILFFFSASVLAADTSPSSVFPGRIEDRLQEPLIPKSKPKSDVERVKPVPLSEKSAGIRLLLSSVTVEGVSVYIRNELQETYKELINKEVTMDEVMSIASNISNKYRDDGYILAQAIIPASQELDPAGAHLKVIVYEGYIDRIVYEDASYQNGDQGKHISQYLSKIPHSCVSDDIPVSDGNHCPLHIDVLERYLLLAKDLAGVEIETVLIPGDITGSSNLYVTITNKHFGAYTSIDNRGSRFIGPTQFWTGLRVDSPFGAFTSTNVDLMIAEEEEVKLIKISEKIPLFSEGLEFRASGVLSTSHLGGSLKPLDVESDNVSFTVGLHYPIIRTRADNLSISGGFTYRNQDTDILGEEFTEDYIRALDIGITYDHADGLFGGGVSLLDFKASHGVDIFSATKRGDELASVSNGDPEFTKLNLHVSRLQRITDDIYLSMEAIGQYAFTPLLISEQFGYGGKIFGRAYDPSEITGDHGVSGSAELQYSPHLPWPYPKGLQYFAYYDIGKVWLKEAVCGCIKVERNASATSAGTGFRFNITEWLSGTVEVAFPLTRQVATESNKEPRFFFGVSARY